MEITYTGGTGQQRALFQNALSHMVYPWDDLEVSVMVSWPVEPSLPGHKEYACTTTEDGVNFALEIRRSLDSDVSQNFYVETVAHELSHVIAFAILNAETVAPWFYRVVSGDGKTWGTAADLDPPDSKWEDRLQEGIAETLKDALLPEQYRDYDNRTSWHIDRARYQDFMALCLPLGSAFTENIFSSSTLTAHLPPEFAGEGQVFSVGWQSELPGGQTYNLRFRFGRGDGGFQGYRDYGPIVVPEGLVLTPYSEPGFPDTGGGSTVVIHTRYLIWDNVDPEGGTETVLESILTVDPDALGFWRQWSILVPAVEPPPPPPWPYTDPHITAGGGEWASVRFRTR